VHTQPGLDVSHRLEEVGDGLDAHAVHVVALLVAFERRILKPVFSLYRL
jgi:hypothetical protein